MKAATKQQYHDAVPNSHSAIYVNGGDDRQAAQSFTTSDPYSISSVKLLIYKINSPGTYTVSIRATSGDTPIDGNLASGEFEGTDLTVDTAGEWKEIIFDTPYELSATTKYAIVIRYSGGGNSGGSIEWLSRSGSSSYPDGVGMYSFNGGSTWPSANVDYNFETWGEEIILTLTYPDNGLTNVYLNEDWLMNFLWEDTDPYSISDYTVHFNDIPQTDRSRYSIIFFKLNLGVTLEYETTYEWFVRKDLGGGEYLDSETWTFTTLTFAPPEHSEREKLVYGEPGGPGDPEGDPSGEREYETIPSGENNMLTVQRLIAAVNNKIFYEDV